MLVLVDIRYLNSYIVFMIYRIFKLSIPHHYIELRHNMTCWIQSHRIRKIACVSQLVTFIDEMIKQYINMYIYIS